MNDESELNSERHASTSEGPKSDMNFSTTAEIAGHIEEGINYGKQAANFTRSKLGEIIGAVMLLSGVLGFLMGWYVNFTLIDDQFLDFGDVGLVVLGVLASTAGFMVIIASHGLQVIQKARAAQQGRHQSEATIVLKAIAGALRGWADAFAVLVMVGIPFAGMQAVVVGDMSMLILFEDGFLGTVLVPLFWIFVNLMFSYLIAEVLETLAEIRENTKKAIG